MFYHLSPSTTSSSLSAYQYYCGVMLCISAAYAVVRCLSVRLSVCLSGCLWRSCIASKRVNIFVNFFSQSGSHTILDFQTFDNIPFSVIIIYYYYYYYYCDFIFIQCHVCIIRRMLLRYVRLMAWAVRLLSVCRLWRSCALRRGLNFSPIFCTT